MDLKGLFEDDGAVSPVIGVVLLVAITVILGAVVATFVLSVGEELTGSAPNAGFTFDFDSEAEDEVDGYGLIFGADETDPTEYDREITGPESDEIGLLVISHAGGPTIESQRLSNSGNRFLENDDDPRWTNPASEYESGDEITAGDSFVMWLHTDDEIRLTWEFEGDSAILQTYDRPDR